MAIICCYVGDEERKENIDYLRKLAGKSVINYKLNGWQFQNGLLHSLGDKPAVVYYIDESFKRKQFFHSPNNFTHRMEKYGKQIQELGKKFEREMVYIWEKESIIYDVLKNTLEDSSYFIKSGEKVIKISLWYKCGELERTDGPNILAETNIGWVKFYNVKYDYYRPFIYPKDGITIESPIKIERYQDGEYVMQSKLHSKLHSTI